MGEYKNDGISFVQQLILKIVKHMDRLLTGRRIINSENHLRELWPFFTKKLAKSCYFDCFCILRTNHPGNQKFAVAISP